MYIERCVQSTCGCNVLCCCAMFVAGLLLCVNNTLLYHNVVLFNLITKLAKHLMCVHACSSSSKVGPPVCSKTAPMATTACLVN